MRTLETIPRPQSKYRTGDWNVRRWSNDDRAKMVGDELRVTCVPRKQGMASGTGFFAMPAGFPATEATVSYEVFFPEDYTWVKGGKVGFGLGLGDGDETASGANWKKKAGSIRSMWRDDGQAIGYLYLPTEGSTRDGVLRKQGPSCKESAEGSLGKPAGIDMFYRNNSGLAFNKGTWNTVTIFAKLNDVGQQNGIYMLTVNGVTREVRDVVYRRKSEKIRINGVMFATFFGGSSLEWACKTPQTVSFRNLKVTSDA